ncbi:MAG: hypothetical protein DRP85_04840 [Candidatus Makaraimicrobium thalassicum]|nr:MAG: hypothetical protein DRP85_04840 [Candidatus Omnitrophota bacterium]
MQLRLPDLSEGAEDAVITLWHAGETDRVIKGKDLVEVTTDKATFDIPVPCDGILVKIFKKKGEKVKTGEDMAEIQEDRS